MGLLLDLNASSTVIVEYVGQRFGHCLSDIPCNFCLVAQLDSWLVLLLDREKVERGDVSR